MSRVKASILINTYNHEDFIEECILSCLSQNTNKEDFEIVVVDDGSTDNNLKIIGKYKDELRIITQKNSGQAACLNRGVDEAKGEILLFLDGDDLFVPTKLEQVLVAFDRDPDVGIVVNGRELKFQNKNDEYRINEVDYPFIVKQTKTFSPGIEAFYMALRAPFTTSAISARKSFLQEILPLDDRGTINADLQLLGLTSNSHLCLIPDKLSIYRIHSNNLHVFNLKNHKLVSEDLSLSWDFLIKTFPESARESLRETKNKDRQRYEKIKSFVEGKGSKIENALSFIREKRKAENLLLVIIKAAPLFIFSPKTGFMIRNFYRKTRFYLKRRF